MPVKNHFATYKGEGEGRRTASCYDISMNCALHCIASAAASRTATRAFVTIITSKKTN